MFCRALEGNTYFHSPLKNSQAYLAGRGNSNVHVITHGHSSLKSAASKDPIPNIVGPAYEASQRERFQDAENTLNFLKDKSTQSEFTHFDDSDGLYSQIIVGNPDLLKRTKTVDVAARSKRWAEALETLPFKTDISQMLGAAYVAGMISPSQTSRFMAVNKAMIKDQETWLGKIRTFKDMADIKAPTQNAMQDDPQRDALVFFSTLV